MDNTRKRLAKAERGTRKTINLGQLAGVTGGCCCGGGEFGNGGQQDPYGLDQQAYGLDQQQDPYGYDQQDDGSGGPDLGSIFSGLGGLAQNFLGQNGRMRMG